MKTIRRLMIENHNTLTSLICHWSSVPMTASSYYLNLRTPFHPNKLCISLWLVKRCFKYDYRQSRKNRSYDKVINIWCCEFYSLCFKFIMKTTYFWMTLR